MKLITKKPQFQLDFNGNVTVSFSVFPESKQNATLMANKQMKDKLSVEVKEYREKRSLNANAYLWVLLEKMAAALNSDKDALYLDVLERYGVFTHIVVKKGVVERIKEEWRAVRELGDVLIGGQTGVQLQCYFGSSTYDTKEMARLLDGVFNGFACDFMKFHTACLFFRDV